MSEQPAPDDRWIAEHFPRLVRSAWLLTGSHSEAEDLAQETLLRALSKWHQFRGDSAASTWLYRILFRLHQKRQRFIARSAARLNRWWYSMGRERQSIDPAEVVSESAWRESLWGHIARLKPPQREAIVLRFAEGLSFEEIASILGCPAGTARSRVFYGLAALREQIGTSNLDPPKPSEKKYESPVGTWSATVSATPPA